MEYPYKKNGCFSKRNSLIDGTRPNLAGYCAVILMTGVLGLTFCLVHQIFGEHDLIIKGTRTMPFLFA